MMIRLKEYSQYEYNGLRTFLIADMLH
jgi:hypothetical protein